MRLREFSVSLSILLASGLLSSLYGSEPSAATVWKTDFNQAEAEAKRLNRPLLVHFHASWCGPCKRMDREVLHSKELLRMLNQGFVAVKVDLDHRPDVAKRYKVEVVPTDVIVGIDGKFMSHKSGYQAKAAYLANVYSANAIAQRARNVAQAESKPTVPSKAVAAEPVKVAAVPQVASVDTPNLNEDPTPHVTKSIPKPNPNKPSLDGYCPVTLWNTRSWRQGQKDYKYEYQGFVYHFVGQKQLDEFKSDPTRFAPKLLGCDPVVMSDSDLAIPGTTRYGAYYEGELYLFESADTRTRFRSDPSRYTRITHVLKADDINRKRS